MTIEITSAIFKKPLTWIIAIVSLALISVGFFAFSKFAPKYFKPIAPPQSSLPPRQLTPDQTRKLVEEVGKLIVLPTGEEPTVATITDITKLSGQSFFQKAQNGDQVLIYSQAKIAYLYSTSLKKILDVQPINSASPSATQSPSPAISTSPNPGNHTPSPTPAPTAPSPTPIP